MSHPWDSRPAVAPIQTPTKHAATVRQTSHATNSGQVRLSQLPPPSRPVNKRGERHAAGQRPFLELSDVVNSIRQSYPLLESAFLNRNIAAGEVVSATGNFDLKLKGSSESGPLGFYETYRHGLGVDQPLFGGGSVFAGYRIGRGVFQPWYLERQTNDGGEFKAGFAVPLAQDRAIDPRRAELFQANLGRHRVEPEIQAQLIEFILFGSLAYWEWVAAGQIVDINAGLLKLATDRQDGIKKRVQKGDLARIAETDNRRLIVSRQAKLTDARRKLQQSAVKLSLYLRNSEGAPVIPAEHLRPRSFPDPQPVDAGKMQGDIDRALANRPELRVLALLKRQVEVDLAQANNLMLPSLDAVVSGSQDVGNPTSSKRDKSEFEFEAGLFLSVPLQRRKARGKITAVEAKIAQLSIKQKFARDKITADVQAAYAALLAAVQQIGQAREALALARTMEEAERKKFTAGDSDLLIVNLRESQTADAAASLVEALLQYFQARVVYRAALALETHDGDPRSLPPGR